MDLLNVQVLPTDVGMKFILGHGEGMNFLVQAVSEFLLFLFQVKMRLKIQPELWRNSEITSKP